MVRVNTKVKFDFSDVLIRPRRSNLSSESQVSLIRSLRFRASWQLYSGIPIMASNMDTVGGFEMAKALHKHSLFTSVHKYCSVDEWLEFARNNGKVLSSQGISEEDQEKVNAVLSQKPQIGYISIDKANGCAQNFVGAIYATRRKFPQKSSLATW